MLSVWLMLTEVVSDRDVHDSLFNPEAHFIRALEQQLQAQRGQTGPFPAHDFASLTMANQMTIGRPQNSFSTIGAAGAAALNGLGILLGGKRHDR